MADVYPTFIKRGNYQQIPSIRFVLRNAFNIDHLGSRYGQQPREFTELLRHWQKEVASRRLYARKPRTKREEGPRRSKGTKLGVSLLEDRLDGIVECVVSRRRDASHRRSNKGVLPCTNERTRNHSTKENNVAHGRCLEPLENKFDSPSSSPRSCNCGVTNEKKLFYHARKSC